MQIPIPVTFAFFLGEKSLFSMSAKSPFAEVSAQENRDFVYRRLFFPVHRFGFPAFFTIP